MLAVGAIAFSLRLNSRFRGKCTPSVACGDSSPGGGAKTRCPLRGKSREAGKGVYWVA